MTSIRRPAGVALLARAAAIILVATGLALAAGLAGARVTPAFNVSAANETKAPRPDIRYGLRLANDTGAAVTFTILPRATVTDAAVPCPTPIRCTLGWQLDGRALPANRLETLTVPAYQSAMLTYEGHAEALGGYQSEAMIAEGAAAAISYPVAMRRVAGDLGTNGVVVGPIGRQTLGFFGEARPLAATISNKATDPVTLSAVRAHLLRDDGGGTYGDTGAQVGADCGSLPVTLIPGESRECRLSLPDWPAAGRYRLSVAPVGAGLGEIGDPHGDFTLRWHWGYALLLLLIGGYAGKKVANYQTYGRRRRLQLAAAMDLKDAATKILDIAGAHSRAIVEKILEALGKLINELDTDATADRDPQLRAIEARLPAIVRFAGLEKRYRAAGSPPAAKQAYEAARAAVSAETLPADAGEKLDALDAAIPATPGLRAADGAGPVLVSLSDRSSAQLRASVRRIDNVIDLLSIVLAATIGIVTVWQPVTTWGSFSDIMLALLIGFGGTFTGSVTLRELVSGYQLGKITRPG